MSRALIVSGTRTTNFSVPDSRERRGDLPSPDSRERRRDLPSRFVRVRRHADKNVRAPDMAARN